MWVLIPSCVLIWPPPPPEDEDRVTLPVLPANVKPNERKTANAQQTKTGKGRGDQSEWPVRKGENKNGRRGKTMHDGGQGTGVARSLLRKEPEPFEAPASTSELAHSQVPQLNVLQPAYPSPPPAPANSRCRPPNSCSHQVPQPSSPRTRCFRLHPLPKGSARPPGLPAHPQPSPQPLP